VVELKSFAKINLGIEITGKRADGYHTLRTIFQTIGLFDRIRIRKNRSGKVTLRGDHPGIDWSRSNTILKSVDIVRRDYPAVGGLSIEVHKAIPPGSGLGGGSSNAGVILLFLNEYFGLKIPTDRLVAMASRVGADVPFFLLGGTAMGEGIGEKLIPVEPIVNQPVAIFIPPIFVSTQEIFSRFNLTKGRFASKIKTFLKGRDFSVLENELESVAFQLFPEIREIKGKMEAGGCFFVQMSGSGSAVYGLGTAKTLLRLKKLLPGVMLTRTMDQKRYREKIGVSPSGKASAFGADIRRFESFHPREKHGQK
jgi:4-diphosphocytidyl-2-C-methyl-D-erythritol kinase